jgi:hypothetical protein
MQQPHLGKTVSPRTVKTTGTSLLHGTAPEQTTWQHWSWAFTMEHPSFSQLPSNKKTKVVQKSQRDDSNVVLLSRIILPELTGVHSNRMASKELKRRESRETDLDSGRWTIPHILFNPILTHQKACSTIGCFERKTKRLTENGELFLIHDNRFSWEQISFKWKTYLRQQSPTFPEHPKQSASL